MRCSFDICMPSKIEELKQGGAVRFTFLCSLRTSLKHHLSAYMKFKFGLSTNGVQCEQPARTCFINVVNVAAAHACSPWGNFVGKKKRIVFVVQFQLLSPFSAAWNLWKKTPSAYWWLFDQAIKHETIFAIEHHKQLIFIYLFAHRPFAHPHVRCFCVFVEGPTSDRKRSPFPNTRKQGQQLI